MYLKGKHDFIVYTLRKALVKSYLGKTVNIKIYTLNWQGHIRSGQGCFHVLLCCFSLRVRPVHVVQAPCRAPKRPLSDSSTSSRSDFGIFKEAEWGVLNVHPLTMTQKMPKSDRWRRVSPCQFRVFVLYHNLIYKSYFSNGFKMLI